MENVLVVKTALLGDIVSVNGLITGREAEVMELIAARGEFLPRPAAEEDPSYKQIIPYVTILRGEQVFATRRLNKGGESRLHGLVSLGVGGHINQSDEKDGDWLMNCLRREVEEEVNMSHFGTLTLRGLINDNGNDVGSVHLGFFFTLTTTGDVSVRETEKLEGGFLPLSSLAETAPQMETWSQIIVPELTDLWTTGRL
ncbi:MAG: NUDIX domain-containing protein [Oscillospiraceae bacterium]|nr:NUDIX domain-containing protein [Oscillospiraceae bacterium]